MSAESQSEFDERIKIIYSIHNQRREEFIILLKHFSIQFLKMLSEVNITHKKRLDINRDLNFEFIIPTDELDGVLHQIDYSKLSCYLLLINENTKRSVRIFVNPLNPQRMVIFGFSIYKHVSKKRISKFSIKTFDLDDFYKEFITPTFTMSIIDFILGDVDTIDHLKLVKTLH